MSNFTPDSDRDALVKAAFDRFFYSRQELLKRLADTDPNTPPPAEPDHQSDPEDFI